MLRLIDCVDLMHYGLFVVVGGCRSCAWGVLFYCSAAMIWYLSWRLRCGCLIGLYLCLGLLCLFAGLVVVAF